MFTEFEKKFIVNHDYCMTTGRLAKRLGRNYMEVYECYSDMVDSGEYRKLRKHTPKGRRIEYERERIDEKSNNKNGEVNQKPDKQVRSSSDLGVDTFNDMWRVDDTTWKPANDTRDTNSNSDRGKSRLRSAIHFAKSKFRGK